MVNTLECLLCLNVLVLMDSSSLSINFFALNILLFVPEPRKITDWQIQGETRGSEDLDCEHVPTEDRSNEQECSCSDHQSGSLSGRLCRLPECGSKEVEPEHGASEDGEEDCVHSCRGNHEEDVQSGNADREVC